METIPWYTKEQISFFHKIFGSEFAAKVGNGCIKNLYNGFAGVSGLDKIGIVDKTGSFICEPKFGWVSEFEYGKYSRVRVGTKWGIIDSTGTYVVEPDFER